MTTWLNGLEWLAVLRIGVGRPPGETVRHVLGRFSADQARVLPQLLDTAADAVEAALQEGVEPAMNRFNRRARKEASES